MQNPTVYDHRNVYDDGAGGGGGSGWPDGLITLDYFTCTYLEDRTAGTINSFDSSLDSPINDTSNLMVIRSNYMSDYVYRGANAMAALSNGSISIEYYAKVVALGTDNNTTAFGGIVKSGNYWAALIAPKTNDANSVAIWHNDGQHNFTITENTTDWNHYEVCIENGRAYYFLNGKLLADYGGIDLDNTFIQLYQRTTNRAIMQMTEFAIWNKCKHKSDFVLNNDPVLVRG